MRRKAFRVLAFALLAVAMVGARGTRSSGSSAERDVLDALLRSHYPSTHDTLVLAESTATFRDPGPPPPNLGPIPSRFAAELGRIPRTLLARLDSSSRESRPTSTLNLPRHTIILSDSTLRAVIPTGGRDGWAEFYRRFPGSGGYFRLSPVALSESGGEALVYLEVHCGGGCGGGTLYWLAKTEGRWSVVHRVPFWIV